MTGMTSDYVGRFFPNQLCVTLEVASAKIKFNIADGKV